VAVVAMMMEVVMRRRMVMMMWMMDADRDLSEIIIRCELAERQ
jgi:hypothetical protein